MDFVDIIEGSIGCLLVAMCVGLVAFLLYTGIDAVFDRQSFAAQATCRVHRMEPTRQSLSAKVICLPVNTRQDTTTVNVR